MHAEHNTELLNSRRCKRSRRHGDLVLLQVLNDLLNPGSVFGILGIIGSVPL